MAAPFLTRRSVILQKAESTYGTDPTPVVGTDAVLTAVPTINTDVQVLDRIVSVNTLSPTQPVIGRKLVRAGFQVEMKSEAAALDGVDSNPIQIDELLRMSGFNPTYTVETSPPSSNDGFVTYALGS